LNENKFLLKKQREKETQLELTLVM